MVGVGGEGKGRVVFRVEASPLQIHWIERLPQFVSNCLAYGEPTLESASGSSYGRNRNVTPATHSSSSTKNGNAESELSGATNTPNSKDLIHDIYIPDAQSSGREGASKPKEKESGFNVRQLQQKRSRHEGDQRLHEAKAHLAIEAVTQQKNELLQKHSSGGQTGGGQCL